MEKYENLGSYTTNTMPEQLKVIHKVMIDALEATRIFKSFFTEDRSMIGTAGNGTKDYRIWDAAYSVISEFLEDEDIPTVVSVGSSFVPFTPTYFGGKDFITGKTLRASDQITTAKVLKFIATGIAVKEDDRCLKAFLNPTVVTQKSTSPATGDGARKIFKLTKEGTNWQNKWLKVTQVRIDGAAKTIGTDFVIDYYNGLVEFVVAPGNGLAVDASGEYTDRDAIDADYKDANGYKGVASYKDLVQIRNLMISNYAKPNSFILNQNEDADLLMDDKYLKALEVNVEKTAVEQKVGLVGNVLRSQVYVSERMYEGVIICCQKGDLGNYLYFEDLMTGVDSVKERPGDKQVKAWMCTIPCVTNAKMIALVLNCQQYAKALTYA